MSDQEDENPFSVSNEDDDLDLSDRKESVNTQEVLIM